MATYYIDGTGGSESNNGLSEGAPKKDFSSSIPVTDGTVVLLRAGTTVNLTANRFPTGNYTVGAYGDGPKPTLAIPGGTYQLSHTGTVAGAVYRMSGIRCVQSGTIGVSSGFAGGSSAATMIAEDLLIEAGFQYGCRIGYGSDFRVVGCTIWDTGVSGVHVGTTGQNAPSRGIVERNVITLTSATDDGITLHDGNTGTGDGNIIRRNWIRSGVENCVDVLKCYTNTRVYENYLEAGPNATSTWSVVVMQGSGDVFRNTIIGGPAVAVLVHPEQIGPVRIRSNFVRCGPSLQNGQFFRTDSTFSVDLSNNTVIGNASAARAMLFLYTTTGLTIKNNAIFHAGDANTMYLIGGDAPVAGSIDGNFYGGSALLASSLDFTAWKTTYSVDSSSTQSSSVAAIVTSSGVPQLGSPLLTGGADLGYLRDIRGYQSRRHVGAYGAARLRAR